MTKHNKLTDKVIEERNRIFLGIIKIIIGILIPSKLI